jgi:hypothetical protein
MLDREPLGAFDGACGLIAKSEPAAPSLVVDLLSTSGMSTIAAPRPLMQDLHGVGKALQTMVEWTGDLGFFLLAGG